MKVFLVSSCSWGLLGIEKCQAFMVPRRLEAAFVRQYAGRIVTSGLDLALLPIPIFHYKGPQGPSLLFLESCEVMLILGHEPSTYEEQAL